MMRIKKNSKYKGGGERKSNMEPKQADGTATRMTE